MTQLLVTIARLIERIARWLGEITSWLALGTLASILVAVIASAMRANEMLIWGVDIPLFGDDLMVNDVIDLEWHFFAVMVMVGAHMLVIQIGIGTPHHHHDREEMPLQVDHIVDGKVVAEKGDIHPPSQHFIRAHRTCDYSDKDRGQSAQNKPACHLAQPTRNAFDQSGDFQHLVRHGFSLCL